MFFRGFTDELAKLASKIRVVDKIGARWSPASKAKEFAKRHQALKSNIELVEKIRERGGSDAANLLEKHLKGRAGLVRLSETDLRRLTRNLN